MAHAAGLEEELLDSARLETLIAADPDLSLAELLHTSDAQSESALHDVDKRDLLFVDEQVRCVIALHLPRCNEALLQDVLSRTELKLEVWVADGAHHRDAPNTFESPRDLIFTTNVSGIEDPIVLAQGAEGEDQIDHLTLAWEASLILYRPKIRMPDPSIYVQAVLLVTPAAELHDFADLLEPFKAMEPNVLEPLQQLPNLHGEIPYLAASRLERVVPTGPKPSRNFRKEHFSSLYKIVPAVIARLRFTKTNSATTTPVTIASLDLEIIPFVNIKGSIREVDMQIANGRAENLMPNFLPMECQSRDLITFLYRLQPSASLHTKSTPAGSLPSPNIDVLNIAVTLLVNGPQGRKSMINMAWNTNIDFFQALNPIYGAPSQPMQRAHRPKTLSLGSQLMMQPQTVNTSLQPASRRTGTANVVISFVAPNTAVRLCKPFKWQVLVVNQGMKPAKLTIIPLPRISRTATSASQFQRRHAPKSSTASFQPAERRHMRNTESEVDFAQAVVDENVVYAMQHTNLVPPETDLMSLTAEIRIGPLNTGQCHETEIEMVAFKIGVLMVDAVRVIDSLREAEEGINAPGVITDIRDLPDIVVEENPLGDNVDVASMPS